MMKILIVSDTHGYHGNFEKVTAREEPFDMLIHLGDLYGEEDYFNETVKCEKHMVRGNNDFFSSLPGEEVFYIGKYKVFITHGHSYHVSYGTEYLVNEARKRGADIVMFGHTHRPLFERRQDIIIVNPGSISYPRQAGRKDSYIIAGLDKAGKIDFCQCFL